MIFPRPESLQPSHIIISRTCIRYLGLRCMYAARCVLRPPAAAETACPHPQPSGDSDRDVARCSGDPGPVAQWSGDSRRCPASKFCTELATIVFCS